jgi:hypothetical protein
MANIEIGGTQGGTGGNPASPPYARTDMVNRFALDQQITGDDSIGYALSLYAFTGDPPLICFDSFNEPVLVVEDSGELIGKGSIFTVDGGGNLSAASLAGALAASYVTHTGPPVVTAGAQASAASLTTGNDAFGIVSVTAVAVPVPGVLAVVTMSASRGAKFPVLAQADLTNATAAAMVLRAVPDATGNFFTIYGLGTIPGGLTFDISYTAPY